MEGEGDCDSDADCQGSLVCVQGSANCPATGAFDSTDDCCFIPGSEEAPRPGVMVLSSGVSGEQDYKQHHGQPPVGAWTTIAISQTLEGNKYMYRISIGGQEVHAKENTQPKVYQGAEVYASKGTAQPGSIRNLVIETKIEA